MRAAAAAITVVGSDGLFLGVIVPSIKDPDSGVFVDVNGTVTVIYAGAKDGDCPKGTCLVDRWCVPC